MLLSLRSVDTPSGEDEKIKTKHEFKNTQLTLNDTGFNCVHLLICGVLLINVQLAPRSLRFRIHGSKQLQNENCIFPLLLEIHGFI